MGRKIVLGIEFFFLVLLFVVCWRSDAEEKQGEWRIYYSDEIATHSYLFHGIRNLERGDREVWAKISLKGPYELLLKEVYQKGVCEGMDFSGLKEIKCIVQINCLNKKYRVVGGLFEGNI